MEIEDTTTVKNDSLSNNINQINTQNNTPNLVENLFENIEQFFTNMFLKDYYENIKKNK
jgi:hypothetical protein|uniref:Uncharacterized protein n=1 Tax=viral metagenome TaxID=1070528 RepID=A0A6C0D9C5_9ZZZZ